MKTKKINKIIISILIIIAIGIGIFFVASDSSKHKIENTIAMTENYIDPEQEEKEMVEKAIEEANQVEEQQEEIPIVEEQLYTTAAVNMRTAPSMEGEIIKVLEQNSEVTKIGEDGEWSKIKWSDTEIYYIYSTYLSTEKTPIKKIETQTTSRGSTSSRYESSSNTGVLTKSKGVNYFNGHKETWYSQKVLPGGGLKIPGRHVAADGTIRDENDYICVASSDYPKGTIVETSLGTGKVYDTGCASGIIDIYTDW